MAKIIITVSVKGGRVDTIQNLIEKQVKTKYKEAFISVAKAPEAESRSDRFSIAQNLIEEGKSLIVDLKEELENWRDNLPENLQSGSKADELEEAISALEEAENSADEIVDADVNFPSMM